MEFVHEVTAYLENKPGRLAKICSALGHEKVNIRALTVMDSADRSVLRFVTDDMDATRRVLTSLGTEFICAEVIATRMDNKPGVLAQILERLAAEHINIEYAYASHATDSGKALAILQTSNPKRALQILQETGSNGLARVRSGGRRPLHSR